MIAPVFKNKSFTIPRWLKRSVRIYPLTLSGTILTLVSIGLFGRSFAIGNPYGVVLSIFALTALLALSVGGRIQAVRFNNRSVGWDSSAHLVAGGQEISHRIWIQGIKPFYFFRIHFKIQGTMVIGRKAYIRVSREASSSGGESVTIPLSFRFAGEFRAKGSFTLRDMFGLTRARFGPAYLRNLIVQPAPFNDGRSYHIEAVGGFEDKNRQKSSDEERYYMREYIPGDRFRDINWKSSSRLSQLITRISPYTQEKTRQILIVFRHYRREGRETVDSIVHLNHLKSWLLFFMRRVKHENPEYQFIVETGRGVSSLETEEDIDSFSQDLSTLFFQPEPLSYQDDPAVNEVYIFSTPYDRKLPNALARYRKIQTHIFRTVVHSPEGEPGTTVHLFGTPLSMGFPGSWFLFKDHMDVNPQIGGTVKGRVEEYPIEVKRFSF
jgi:uncharacterized protein (DUF58 family)